MSFPSPHKFGKMGINREEQHYKHLLDREDGFQPSPLKSTTRGLHTHTPTSMYAAGSGTTACIERTGCGHFKGQAQELQYTEHNTPIQRSLKTYYH